MSRPSRARATRACGRPWRWDDHPVLPGAVRLHLFPDGKGLGGEFTQPLTRTDALYFTVTVFSTVGFGDISPKLEAARVVLIAQMLSHRVLSASGHGCSCWLCSAAGSKPRIRAAALARPHRDRLRDLARTSCLGLRKP